MPPSNPTTLPDSIVDFFSFPHHLPSLSCVIQSPNILPSLKLCWILSTASVDSGSSSCTTSGGWWLEGLVQCEILETQTLLPPGSFTHSCTYTACTDSSHCCKGHTQFSRRYMGPTMESEILSMRLTTNVASGPHFATTWSGCFGCLLHICPGGLCTSPCLQEVFYRAICLAKAFSVSSSTSVTADRGSLSLSGMCLAPKHLEGRCTDLSLSRSHSLFDKVQAHPCSTTALKAYWSSSVSTSNLPQLCICQLPSQNHQVPWLYINLKRGGKPGCFIKNAQEKFLSRK